MIPNVPPSQIAIYLRTSTRTQRVEETIKSQYNFAQYWLKRYNIDIAECRVFKDDGVSSSILMSSRGAGKQLIAACQRGEIKVVCFYAIDRLSREARGFHEFEDILRRNRVTMISMSENLSTENEDDAMMMEIYATLARRERRKITKRSLIGKVRIAEEGKWTGGRPPYGYKIVNQRLAIKEPEAGVVRMIFDFYLKYHSTTMVKYALHARSIPSPYGKKWWNTNTLPKILRNKLYMGIKIYYFTDRENVEVPCPVIVSEEIWLRTQRILDFNYNHQGTFNADKPYLLSNLLFCGECGLPYHGAIARHQLKHGMKTYRRYHHGTSKKVDCPLPRKPMIQVEVADKMVWDKIIEWVGSPDEAIEEVQKELEGQTTGPIQESLDQLRKQLKKAEQKRDRTVKFLTDGIIQPSEAEKPLASARQEISLIQEEIKQKEELLASTQKRQEYITNTKELLNALQESAKDADDSTKREIVLTLVSRIDLYCEMEGRKKGQSLFTMKIHSCF